MLADVKQVEEGESHACLITNGGGVKCWGNNEHGEIGDSTGFNRVVPVDVTGLTSDVESVSAGGRHTCAVTKHKRTTEYGRGR